MVGGLLVLCTEETRVFCWLITEPILTASKLVDNLYNHLDKYISQWEGLSHILWKNKKCLKPPTSKYRG